MILARIGLDHGLGRWCILLLDFLELFFELICPDIIHLAQLVELAERELGLAQFAQAWLGIVLCDVLVGFGRSFVELIEYHRDI